MFNAYIILDNSISMSRFAPNAHAIAEAFMNGANKETQYGFISFNDRVYMHNYFENHPQPLLNSLHGLSRPRGTTELADAMLVSLCIDSTKPNTLFVISDGGENTSEVNMKTVQSMLDEKKVEVVWIKPPPSLTIKPPLLTIEPPVKVKLLEGLKGVKRMDLSRFDDTKLAEAAGKIRVGQMRALLTP